MTVVRLADRINQEIRDRLAERAAPDDVVEFEATVMPVEVPHWDEEGDIIAIEHEVVVSIYAALAVPEIEDHECMSTAYVQVPIHRADTRHLAKVVDRMWERLVFNRIRSGAGGELDFEGVESFCLGLDDDEG